MNPIENLSKLNLTEFTELIQKLLNISLPIIVEKIREHNTYKKQSRIDMFLPIILEEQKGVKFYSSLFSGDIEPQISYSSIPVFRFSEFYLFEIIKSVMQHESFKKEMEYLKELGFYSTILEYHISFKNFLLGRIISCCFQELINPFINLEDPEEISKIHIDFDRLNNIIKRKIKIEAEKLIEIEYFYLFYGFRLEGHDIEFKNENNEKLIVGTSESIEKLSLCPNIPTENFSSERGLSKWDFIVNTAGWIQGICCFPLDELEQNSKLKTLKIRPASYYEEALQLLGYTYAKVRLISRSSHYSPYPITFHVTKGGFGYTFPHVRLNWIDYEWFNRNSKDVLRINSPEFNFIFNYLNLWEKPSEQPFQDLIFGRFSRFYQANNIMDLILEGCILLEVLISTSTSEIRFQFSTKIALLLGDNIEQRQKISELVKKFYDIRSKIVHEGGGKSYQNLIKQLKDQVKDIEKFTNFLVRCVLFQFFRQKDKMIVFMPKNQINSFLDKIILGESLNQEQFELQLKFKQEFLDHFVH